MTTVGNNFYEPPKPRMAPASTKSNTSPKSSSTNDTTKNEPANGSKTNSEKKEGTEVTYVPTMPSGTLVQVNPAATTIPATTGTTIPGSSLLPTNVSIGIGSIPDPNYKPGFKTIIGSGNSNAVIVTVNF